MIQQQQINLLGETIIVSFPNVGQTLNIESLKTAISNGTYGDLVRANTIDSNFALDLIDSISVFSILVGDFNKKINVKSYTDLDLLTAKKIVKTYKKEFFPWYNDIMKELKSFDEDESTTE